MNEAKIGREISGCETLIMKVVWDAETDLSTSELIDELKIRFHKDYARTTVVTFLQRLSDKGFVTTYRKGRIAYIHPLKDEEAYKAKLFKEQTDFWFQGSVSKLMSALCSTKKLSEQEIQEIRDILDAQLDN